MKARLCYYVKGIVVIDDKGNILAKKRLTPQQLDRALSSEELLPEEKEVLDNLKGYDIVSEIKKRSIKQEKGCCKEVRERMRVLAREEDIKQQIFDITSLRFKTSFTKDKIVVMLTTAIAGYEKVLNDKVMRLKELVVYAYPGFYESIGDNKKFVKLLAEGKAKAIGKLQGASYDSNFLELIMELARNAHELYELKEKLEKLMFKYVKEVMPNTSYVIGEKLAAKLLEEAGSLEKLAKMPSSTIQVIGAEKALFMHLLGKGKSPKHGIIFLSEYIQKTPEKKRGRVARILALKISKAVKLDYFDEGKVFKGDEIKRELEDTLLKLSNNARTGF